MYISCDSKALQVTICDRVWPWAQTFCERNPMVQTNTGSIRLWFYRTQESAGTGQYTHRMIENLSLMSNTSNKYLAGSLIMKSSQ